jgi:hypothetical protein
MIRNLIVFGTFALASLTAADFASAQVTTNAAQKALAAGSAPYIQRAGYYAPGDGGGALYRWDKTSTCTDDGGSCIMPNRVPAQGRWILDQNGAVSVKVFGAVCDGTTNDAAAFNAALVARTAVFVPANMTCAIRLASSSDGLVLHDQNHLYGQNQYTSQINVFLDFTPSYDFVAGGRFGPTVSGTGIVVSGTGTGNATVTTGWSHELRAGQSITIAGSATTALNNAYTIVAITAPNKFTITTSGVANGTYTDPTSLVGPSGIGTDVVRSVDLENTNSGVFARVEVDHLMFQDTSGLPHTFIDMTAMRSSRFHDLFFYTNGPATGNVGFVCADQSPGNHENSCFFNNVTNVSGQFGTVLHHSAKYGNSSVNTFHQFDGYARVGIDVTGTTNSSMYSVYMNWYIDEDTDPNSWDMYYVPANSTYINMAFEDYANTYGVPGTFAVVPAVSDIQVGLPRIVTSQGVTLPITTVAGLPACASTLAGTMRAVSDATSPTYNGTLTGGGSTTIPVFCNGSAWTAH